MKKSTIESYSRPRTPLTVLGERTKRQRELLGTTDGLIGLLVEAISDLLPYYVDEKHRFEEAKRYFGSVVGEKAFSNSGDRVRRAALLLTPKDPTREPVTVILAHPKSKEISEEEIIDYLTYNDGYAVGVAKLYFSSRDPELFWKIWEAREELITQTGKRRKKQS